MKFSLELTYNTTQEWVDCVLNNFDSFLQDHADCERKASAMAMSFVAKCPDKVEIIPELIETALEEMEHFRDVYRVMESRGILLNHEIEQDLYIKQLINACRSGRDDRRIAQDRKSRARDDGFGRDRCRRTARGRRHLG